jgi:polysaccharide pyruvyl transferase WcaK-like protein
MDSTDSDRDLEKIPFPKIKSAKNIVIVGNYGGGNLGDEVMLDMLIKIIQEKLAKVKVIVPSRRPDVIRKLHSSTAIYPVNIKEGILRALTSDILLVGGGTIFSDVSGSGIFIITLIAIIRKIVLKKQTYFYGIGYSSSTPNLLSKFAKIALKVSDGVYVRDSISFDILKAKFGIKSVFRMPELALSLKESNWLPDEIVEVINNREGPLIGFSLMHRESLDYDRLIASIKGTIKYLHSKYNASFCFLTFQPRVIDYHENWRSDQEVGELIVSRLPSEIGKKCHVLGAYPPDVTLKIISKLDSIISMRYHCLVFASMQHRPYVAISFDDKHKAFIKDYGGESIPLDNITADGLVAKWEKLYK